MSDIFFIHSSISGHFFCFSVLAIVNNAAVNMGMHIVIFISLDSMPWQAGHLKVSSRTKAVT